MHRVTTKFISTKFAYTVFSYETKIASASIEDVVLLKGDLSRKEFVKR